MKKPIHVFQFFSVCLIALSCTSGNDDKQVVVPTKISADIGSYQKLSSQYSTFLTGLESGKRDLISNRIKELESTTYQINGRTNQEDPTDPVCNCSPGQSSCSASGEFSSCCICCTSGVSAVCSTTFGFSSCKCNEDTGGEKAIVDSGSSGNITFYPAKFNDLLGFAQQNGIDVSSIKNSLYEFIKNNSK